MALPTEQKILSEALFRKLGLVAEDHVLDLHGMMTHILECIMALHCISKHKKESSLQSAYNIVYKEALLFTSLALFDSNKRDSREKYLLQAVAPSNNKDEKSSWFPLNWAVLLCDKVGDKIVQDIYNTDPMALCRTHSIKPFIMASPAHLLCASTVCTKQQLSLVTSFIIRNPKAFTVDSRGLGVLHALARYSSDLNLLRTMIQLAPNDVSTKYDGVSPLDILIRERFLESDKWLEMVECLLALDNSPSVVYNAVAKSFFHMKDNSRLFNIQDEEGEVLRSKCINFIEKVLRDCPAAITYQAYGKYGILCSLFKSFSKCLSEYFVLDLMNLIVSIDKQAVRLLNSDGSLPLHHAIQFGGISCVSFLLNQYPESATIVDIHCFNILHHAIYNPSEEVILYLLGEFPELCLQYNNDGILPFHYYIQSFITHHNMNIVSRFWKIDPDILKKPTLDTASLPLHLHIETFKSEPVSPAADILRLFLHLYPAAVNIKDIDEKTPYDIAVRRKLDTYFLRLLLRADVSINPQELHRLNYQERRMALLISSGAAVYESTKEPIIWRMLWIENKEVLKKVVSFL